MPSASTYEFSSFRAMSDAVQPPRSPSSAAAHHNSRVHFAAPEPWVPSGPNQSHLRARGLPSRIEREAAAEYAARAEAAADRDSTSLRLDCAEVAFGRLEESIGRLSAEYQQHCVAATAATVLVQKRLAQLGLGAAK
jgi:hypothetical protein